MVQATVRSIIIGITLVGAAAAGVGGELAARRGEVTFVPAADEARVVPEPFRLAEQAFAFEQKPTAGTDDVVTVSLLTFPSPVKTPHVNNNTVHCEYFRPTKPGRYPACVVLHILGGDFPLARVFAHYLAQHGVAALFVKMPYYGERRQPDVNVRMVSTNPQETVQGMTQAVKDIRYAAAWLAAQDEVDAKQLGVFGISLGGITASLAATAEPRFVRICPVLAGGDLCRILRDSQEQHLVIARQRWLAAGHTLEELLDLIKIVDPCTYGSSIIGRKILMLNAEHDEVIPRACTDSLWEAFGRPKTVWYNCGHYTALLHIPDALEQVARFFGEASEGGGRKAEGGKEPESG